MKIGSWARAPGYTGGRIFKRSILLTCLLFGGIAAIQSRLIRAPSDLQPNSRHPGRSEAIRRLVELGLKAKGK
jgi:hypothetical protein